jgi:hypothetical protein
MFIHYIYYQNNSATALASIPIDSVHTLQVVCHTTQRTLMLLQLPLMLVLS